MHSVWPSSERRAVHGLTIRFVTLARIGDRSTEQVTDALKRRAVQLPAYLARSLTWDQGMEMSAHQRFTGDTGIEVYFCDPHSPWQRGSNENTNGLLRQYLPKGTDLSVHDQAALDRISDSLNGRPRKTLGWATPAEKMAELLETPRPDRHEATIAATPRATRSASQRRSLRWLPHSPCCADCLNPPRLSRQSCDRSG
jgi:IS30 family transposase